MKRWLTGMLVIALLIPAAFAAEWKDGRSPSKPYIGLPEVNLEETLGYILFYPNRRMPCPHNCRSLQVYLPRRDVAAGSGTLYLCSQENGEEARIAFNDEDHVTLRDMTAEEVDSVLWDDGVCFEIRLDTPLKMKAAYFVNMEENCIMPQDGEIGNVTIGGTDSCTFETNAEYGFKDLVYHKPLSTQETAEEEEKKYETLIKPVNGAEVTFDLVLGGDAKMAALYCMDDSVEFETTLFTESTTVTGTILADDPAWGIIFLDEAGNQLWSEDF